MVSGLPAKVQNYLFEAFSQHLGRLLGSLDQGLEFLD